MAKNPIIGPTFFTIFFIKNTNFNPPTNVWYRWKEETLPYAHKGLDTQSRGRFYNSNGFCLVSSHQQTIFEFRAITFYGNICTTLFH